MSFHRYCSQCGTGFSREQWDRSRYCCMCGTRICRDAYGMPSGPVFGVIEGMVSGKAVKPLQTAWEIVGNHPLTTALGTAGAGAAGIILSPMAMAAAQGVAMAGGALLIFGAFAKADSAIRYGGLLLVSGAVLAGSSFVLMGAGGVAVAAGIGLGAYSGVKAITNRRSRPITNNEPLLLEGGDNEY